MLNRRGRAPSGPLGANYTVRTEIDDLHLILDEPGMDCHLFGWSYGGLVAIEVAVERVDLRSLTLYEPVTVPFAAEHVATLRRGPRWAGLVPLAAPVAEELAALNAHSPALGRYPSVDAPVTLMVGELSEGRAAPGRDREAARSGPPRARDGAGPARQVPH